MVIHTALAPARRIINANTRVRSHTHACAVDDDNHNNNI